jgi:hypothetical protein
VRNDLVSILQSQAVGAGQRNTIEKDPFRRPKNSPYTANIGFLFRWRNTSRNSIGNGGKNGASVTTSHVFWPNQRRRGACLLPIRLRNSGILGCLKNPDAKRGGAGGSAGRSRQDALIHKLARNFIANSSPALFCGFKKQRPPQTTTPCADVGASLLAPSRELAIDH